MQEKPKWVGLRPGSPIGGPFDPCREARYTAQLAREDMDAGHRDGEQYWKGQSTAFGFVCSLQNNAAKEGVMVEGNCDPGDIECHEANLNKMKNLRGAFDDPNFKVSHPSLVELAPQLDQAIKEEEETLTEKRGFCEVATAPPGEPPTEAPKEIPPEAGKEAEDVQPA